MKKLGRNDPCWCGSGRKYKACHMAFDEKIQQYALEGHMSHISAMGEEGVMG